jgi:hypothetical protein
LDPKESLVLLALTLDLLDLKALLEKRATLVELVPLGLKALLEKRAILEQLVLLDRKALLVKLEQTVL